MRSAEHPHNVALLLVAFSCLFAMAATAQSPDLTVKLSHSPDPFVVGHTATYTMIISNTGTAATSTANVNVADALPVGLVATGVSGAGWNCSFSSAVANCNRSDALAPGSSYPPLTVTVRITGEVRPITINTVTASGGGDL